MDNAAFMDEFFGQVSVTIGVCRDALLLLVAFLTFKVFVFVSD